MDMRIKSRALPYVAIFAATIWSEVTVASEPDHPIITEVYTDPVGENDGPVGRDPNSIHQEFIEIYLPTAASLRPELNKDALNLTFYEVEGDTSSSGLGLVNYRFDLPTLDLDLSNGTTPGAVARPSSGVVVLGWLDYVGDPPTDLAGTPSSRIALINGGITSTTDFVFVAINGNQFGGTTNFPVVVAESLIDVPNETRSGIVQNGSGAYLLVNRDSDGYVELFDDQHVPDGESADPDLPSGAVLQTSALLDGFAANDDHDFEVSAQPYEEDADVDLAAVLPLGGAFSTLVCQMSESCDRPVPGTANGYARVFVDVPKTTEIGIPEDDDPVTDALNAYRHVRNTGPFYATPGRAALTTSAPELSVALSSEHTPAVLTQTTGRPGVLCANIGGDFAIDLTAVPGASSDPSVATFAIGDPALNVAGQSLGFPTIALTPTASAAHGATASATVTVSASNSDGGPPVENAIQTVEVIATVLAPTTGLDANGDPFQTSVFLAVQAIPAGPELNEFLDTDLGAFVATNLGGLAQDTRGFGDDLVDPNTNLSDSIVVLPMVEEFPEEGEECTAWLNPSGAPGTLDLVETVLTSAEVLSGATTYDNSIGICDSTSETVLQAISLDIPDTLTSGGGFSPSEMIHFAQPGGFVGDPRSGLSNATTSRTFELVLVDTNVRYSDEIETGATDDFGVVVVVGETEASAPVVPGEFVFLSFTGGLQGADIDSLQVSPGDDMVANLLYLDLDNLHDVLGVRSIDEIYLIDGSGNGEVDVIEAFSLNPVDTSPPCPGDLDGDRDVDLADLAQLLGNYGTTQGATYEDGDLDEDGDVDLADLAALLGVYGITCP
jgi:hypothetical protein